MITLDFDSISTWITAFFVLAGFAAVLSVVGFAMILPRRAVRPSHEAQVAPVAPRQRVLEGVAAR